MSNFEPANKNTAAALVLSLVVSVERAELPVGVATVTVESFGDLLRLAQIEASPILHVEGDTHEWATSAMGVWYRFVLVKAALEATAGDDGSTEHELPGSAEVSDPASDRSGTDSAAAGAL